jgi:hypothetical protein
MVLDLQQHEEDLNAWMFDERKVITARYLAQVLNVPTADARRLLAAFYRRHKGKVLATFLLTGERHPATPSQPVAGKQVLILPESRVKAEKDRFFARLDGVQLFSLHATPSTKGDANDNQGLGPGGARLWAEDMALANELLDAASDAGESFRLNKLSGISCPQIDFSAKGVRPAPQPPAPSAAASSSSSGGGGGANSSGGSSSSISRAPAASSKPKGKAMSVQNFFSKPAAKKKEEAPAPEEETKKEGAAAAVQRVAKFFVEALEREEKDGR